MAGRPRQKKPKRLREGAVPARPALGNDPFQRGAAARPIAPQPPGAASTAAPAAEPANPADAATTAAGVPPTAPPGPAAAAPAPVPSTRSPAPVAAPPVAPAAPATGPATASPVAVAPQPVPAGSRERRPAPAPVPATAGAPSSPAPPRAVAPRTPPAGPARAAPAAGAPEPLAELRRTLSGLLPLLKDRLSQARHLLDLGGDLDPWGMDPELPERAFALLDFLYGAWWRVDVRNVERVPSAGGAVVVANHGGALPWDALVLRLALLREHPAHRELRPLLDEASFRTALVGKVAARLGAVPASPENARRLLAAGKLVAAFPEGSAGGAKPWSERYRLQTFGRGGFAKVAIRAGVPIVPCAVVGSEEATPPFTRAGWLGDLLGLPLLALAPGLPLGPAALLPLPSRWSVRFGDPIPTAGLGEDRAADPAAVNALAEETRAAVQRMLDEDVAARRSVFL